MELWNDHEVHRRRRVDIVKRENIVVLVYLPARNRAGYDFAENAIFQVTPLSG
jgi:hypothetical protein